MIFFNRQNEGSECAYSSIVRIKPCFCRLNFVPQEFMRDFFLIDKIFDRNTEIIVYHLFHLLEFRNLHVTCSKKYLMLRR